MRGRNVAMMLGVRCVRILSFGVSVGGEVRLDVMFVMSCLVGD